MNPSVSPGVTTPRMSCAAVGSKSTVPENSPARKYDPSVSMVTAASVTACVASGVVSRYPGRQVPPPAKLASQSGLVMSQLPNPAAQTALAQELALLHVNRVLASVQALSPHAAQSRSVPRAVPQHGSDVQWA